MQLKQFHRQHSAGDALDLEGTRALADSIRVTATWCDGFINLREKHGLAAYELSGLLDGTSRPLRRSDSSLLARRRGDRIDSNLLRCMSPERAKRTLSDRQDAELVEKDQLDIDSFGRHRLQKADLRNFSALGVKQQPLTRPARLMVMRARVSHSSIEIPAANTAIARCSADSDQPMKYCSLRAQRRLPPVL